VPLIAGSGGSRIQVRRKGEAPLRARASGRREPTDRRINRGNWGLYVDAWRVLIVAVRHSCRGVGLLYRQCRRIVAADVHRQRRNGQTAQTAAPLLLWRAWVAAASGSGGRLRSVSCRVRPGVDGEEFNRGTREFPVGNPSVAKSGLPQRSGHHLSDGRAD
jgi:hypothetical protein